MLFHSFHHGDKLRPFRELRICSILVSVVTFILGSLVVPWLVLSSLLFFQSPERIILIRFGVSALALGLSSHSPCWFSD